MSTGEKHSARKKRRKKRIFFRTILCLVILASVVGAALWYRISVKRKLDVSEPYQIDHENDTSRLSAFALQSLTGTGTDLVASEAEEGSDKLSLSEGTERALLFNLDDKSAVFAHGIYDRVYPASLTKIMTALVCLENASMSATVTMQDSDFDLDTDAQQSQLDSGDTLTMEDLMKLLLVYSANEAAMAIARTVAGSTEAFVAKMNEKAAELGMTGTHFVNPTGLHDDDHYTTPYDIYLMMNAAYQHPEFAQMASIDSLEVSVTGTEGESTFTEESTDEYLTGIYSLPQNITIMASKTGTTDEAGSCLALIVQNGYGVSYCAIVTGASDKDTLYGDMSSLLSLVNEG